MIQITERAQSHFRRLIEQQGDDDLGIRIAVTDAGTPSATCDLGFCEPADLDGRETALPCDGFVLYVAADSVEWLTDARIDFETERAGGRLNIAAPGIRGQVPGDDAGLAAQVQYLLDAEINPRLASHGGRVRLVEIDADDVAVLEFGGGCHGCGMVDVTLRQGVETTLRQRLPAVRGVRDVTDHDSGENPYYSGPQGESAVG